MPWTTTGWTGHLRALVRRPAASLREVKNRDGAVVRFSEAWWFRWRVRTVVRLRFAQVAEVRPAPRPWGLDGGGPLRADSGMFNVWLLSACLLSAQPGPLGALDLNLSLTVSPKSEQARFIRARLGEQRVATWTAGQIPKALRNERVVLEFVKDGRSKPDYTITLLLGAAYELFVIDGDDELQLRFNVKGEGITEQTNPGRIGSLRRFKQHRLRLRGLGPWARGRGLSVGVNKGAVATFDLQKGGRQVLFFDAREATERVEPAAQNKEPAIRSSASVRESLNRVCKLYGDAMKAHPRSIEEAHAEIERRACGILAPLYRSKDKAKQFAALDKLERRGWHRDILGALAAYMVAEPGSHESLWNAAARSDHGLDNWSCAAMNKHDKAVAEFNRKGGEIQVRSCNR